MFIIHLKIQIILRAHAYMHSHSYNNSTYIFMTKGKWCQSLLFIETWRTYCVSCIPKTFCIPEYY